MCLLFRAILGWTAGGWFAAVLLSARGLASSVTFAWDPSPDPLVSSYFLYFGEVGGWNTNKLSIGPGTSAYLDGLTAGTAYFFYVTASESGGPESLPSNLLTFTPALTNAPGTTTDPTSPPGSTNNPPGSTTPGSTNGPPSLPPATNAPPTAITNAPTPLSLTVHESLLTWENAPTPIASVHVTAPPDRVDLVSLSAQSLNPDLVPTENVLFGGTGASRFMVVVPAPGRHGTAKVLVEAVHNDLVASQSVEITILPVSPGPSIFGLPGETYVAAGQSRPIPFQVSEPALQVNLQVNPNPVSWVQTSGAGTNRTLILSPPRGITTDLAIVLSAQDSEGSTSQAWMSVHIIQPHLSIAPSTNGFVLFWPNLSGVHVQSCNRLPGTWLDLPQTPYSTNDGWQIEVPNSTRRRFFQLSFE